MSFNYVGGKARLADKILKHFPPHKTYIEAFGGAGSILFLKKPSKLEIWNDLDDGLASIFLCLKNPDLQKDLYNILKLTPPSRFEFDFLKKYSPIEVVQKAYKKLYVLYYSFNSMGNSFAPTDATPARLHKIPFSKLDAWINVLRDRNIVIENLTYQKLLKNYLRGNAVVYCDPPYYLKRSNYDFDFKPEDHQFFFEIMLTEFQKPESNTFFISYNDCKEVREAFSSYYFKEFEITYTISSNSNHRKHCEKTELLISNKPFREHHIYNSQSETLEQFFKTPEEALV